MTDGEQEVSSQQPQRFRLDLAHVAIHLVDEMDQSHDNVCYRADEKGEVKFRNCSPGVKAPGAVKILGC